MYRFFKVLSLILFTIGLIGCVTAYQHQKELHSTGEKEMTVGIVQKEIRKGMNQADVAAALGSPNIVTKDSEGKETWIYDKIATEASYSQSTSNIGGVAGGGGVTGSVLLLGLLSGGHSKSAGAYSSTQKTLTVIIKYDEKHLVEDFTYHSSKF